MRKWNGLALRTVLLAAASVTLLGGGAALAAAPGDAPPGGAAPGEGKPLAGKDAFSMDKYQDSLWTPEKRQIEQKKSDARKRKIEGLLSLVNDPSYPNKADAYFRLAETHWEEAKYEYFLAREKYDAAYACWEEKRCSAEPIEPTEDYSTAIDYYRKVLLADPNYKRLDQVTYYLGRAAIEAGKAKKDRQLEKEGEKYLQDVIQKYPESPRVPESHLTLAEYYFDKDSLYYAKTNYEKIIQNFPNHAMFNYALYKLGWVYFNLAEFNKTIDTFKRVIASMKSQKGGGVIEFRSQALKDLIQAYAELDNGWRMARDYFMDEVGEKDTYDKLDQMASLLVTKDRDEEAIDLYQHLIQHDKSAAKVVEYYDALLEVRRKIGDMVEIERQIDEIADVFAPNGAWLTANKNNKDSVARAHELVSSNLMVMANFHHREAQKAEDKRKTADAQKRYADATRYYKLFLDRYPDHPESYKLNFYYAEILFDNISDEQDPDHYLKAAEQYEKVLDKDQKGEFVEDAALGVVYAMESELDRQSIRKKVAGGEVKVVKLDQDVKREADKEIEVTDLHPLEQRMIAAADKYVEVLQSALKDPDFVKKYPDRGKKIPTMMYIAAEMFYAHGQFKDAVSRLQVIFDLFPKDKMAHYAVNLIIDAYKRLKRWEQIEYWARELIKKKNFAVKSKAELEKIIAIAKTEHATDLTRQRRYDEAVKVQKDIVDEFGRKNREVASKALFNIGAIHEIARRFPQAVEAYEDVIKRYKDMEVAVAAQAAIGILYENQTEFEKAAEAFVGMQQFKQSFRKNPKVAERAADAYRDAGVLYEALEQYDKAREVFDSYVKIYKDRDDVPVVAFQAGRVLEEKNTAESNEDAGKHYEKLTRSVWARKDAEYKLRAFAAAGMAFKHADKDKNRRKVEGLLRSAVKEWANFVKAAAKEGLDTPKVDPATKFYAASAQLELAEYKYDDYAKLKIDAVNKRGEFDMTMLSRTLKAKAEALIVAKKAFELVLDYKDKGMAAAAAFRMGQVLYEFAQNLFDAPAPPSLSPEEVEEYQFALQDTASPIQEQALAAFTAALRQAVHDGVYNKWSRLSAIYAAKVNKDEFPIAEFTVQPDKTRDTLQSTSFIKAARRGSIVVDYLRQTTTDKAGKAEGEGEGEGEGTKDETKEEGK
ncbi:MAG: tetratricopeptide repeat protein [Deltaproteobacteria bacterium]|nr:MAG: tetratricopeptide repeat protein [Deltaproteobacteria bacterium]